MTRTVLAIMAGLLCALVGLKYASSLKSEALRLARWVELLRHLSLLLTEGTMPLPQALVTAADAPAPPDKLLRDMAALLQQQPLTTLEAAFLRCCGDWREKPALQRMFARLGRGSRESRLLAVEQAAGELSLMGQQASATAEKDVKLWQTLGFVGGTCLTILLL